MADNATLRSRIGDAREHVRERVDGLHRRIARVRSFVANPWLQFGAAVAAGYLLGCEEHAETTARKPDPPETIVHAVVRTALVTFVSSGIRRAMSSP